MLRIPPHQLNDHQRKTLADGSAPRIPQDESQASYFGGRRPDDGALHWQRSAQQCCDLIRAVTQPFPGAHFAVFPPKLIEPCVKAGTRCSFDGVGGGDRGRRLRPRGLVGGGVQSSEFRVR